MSLKTWVGDIVGLTSFLGSDYLAITQRRNKSLGAIELAATGIIQINEPGEYEINCSFVSGALSSPPGQLILVRDPNGTPFQETSVAQTDPQDSTLLISSLEFVGGELFGFRWSEALNLTFPTSRNQIVTVTKVSDS